MGIRQGIFTEPKKQFELKRCPKRKVKLQRVQSIALYKLSCFFDISKQFAYIIIISLLLYLKL